jgi:hypothetical protein
MPPPAGSHAEATSATFIEATSRLQAVARLHAGWAALSTRPDMGPERPVAVGHTYHVEVPG